MPGMKTTLGILVILALIVGGAWFLSKKEPVTTPLPAMNSYENLALGISFQYPSGYELQEVPSEGRYSIVLTREEDATPPENGEGPTAITINLYETDATLEEWLATTSSNYALGDGTYVETSAAGTDAVRYGWSGLYEGETTAFAREGLIVAASVTYLAPADAIRADYESVLSSLSAR